MTSRPAISVIMPVFNGATFLADAIHSVIAQDHDPLQIIVVDDGSTDDTAGVAAGFGDKILYHRQENAGPPVARNHGLSMAEGELVAFLDADDLYMPTKFAQQIARLERYPESDIVIGMQRYELLDDAREVTVPERDHNGDQFSLQLGCGLFRRRAFDIVGHFNPALRYCDDWDWFLRAREMGTGIVIHRDLVLRQRLHGANLTRRREENARYQRLAFKLSIDRRRERGHGAVSLPPLASFLETAAV